jgi:O-antigen/teichoic acid export membrane protein
MYEQVRNLLRNNHLLRHTAVLLSGNGAAMVIPFLLAPIITRLYTPADFAAYELYVKLLSLIAVVASLRYELAIVLPASEKQAQSITKLCFRLLIWISFFSGLSIFARFEIAESFENASLVKLVWWLPLGIGASGAIALLTQVAMRLGKFNLMSFNKIIGVGGNHSSKVILGLFYPSPLSLVLGHLLGLIIPIMSLLANRQMRHWSAVALRSTAKLRKVAVAHKDFPLYNGGHAFYEEASRTLLFLIISVGYGEIVLGLFAFAFRYLRIPLQVMGSSLSQVLTPQLARLRNEKGEMRGLILKSAMAFGLIGVIPFSVLMIYGVEIFSFIFGDEWSDAGKYAAVISPWLFANFVSSPISTVPTVMMRQRAFMWINIWVGLATLVVVYFMYMTGADFLSVLIFMTIANTLLSFGLVAWFWKIAKVSA